MPLTDRPRYDGALAATVGGILDRVRLRGASLDLCDSDRLDGRTCLVTGANRGLGLAVAKEIARRGAHLVLACRSGLREAQAAVEAEGGAGRVTGLALDLGDLDAVEAAVAELERSGARVDRLVLNAGIVPREARRTPDGFDESFQVNFLANVLFTRRVLERGLLAPVDARDMPRVVVVSSESHRSAPPIDWAHVGAFRPWGMREAVEQYGVGKLLLQTFTEELCRRTRARAAVHSLCPGAVRTDIGREAPAWAKPILSLTMRAFFSDPADAAIPVVYLAAARALEGRTGIYLHGKRRRDPSDAARDPRAGARLWAEAERILADACHALAPAEEPR